MTDDNNDTIEQKVAIMQDAIQSRYADKVGLATGSIEEQPNGSVGIAFSYNDPYKSGAKANGVCSFRQEWSISHYHNDFDASWTPASVCTNPSA